MKWTFDEHKWKYKTRNEHHITPFYDNIETYEDAIKNTDENHVTASEHHINTFMKFIQTNMNSIYKPYENHITTCKSYRQAYENKFNKTCQSYTNL